MRFDIVHYSETIVRLEDVTDGDALELERLTCEARALRATMRRKGSFYAIRERMARVQREAAIIAARYRA